MKVVGLSAFIVAMLTLGWVNGTDLDMDLIVPPINQKETCGIYGEHLDSEGNGLIKPEEVDNDASLAHVKTMLDSLFAVDAGSNEAWSDTLPYCPADWSLYRNTNNSKMYDVVLADEMQCVKFYWRSISDGLAKRWIANLTEYVASIRLHRKIYIHKFIQDRSVQQYTLLLTVMRLLVVAEIELFEVFDMEWSLLPKNVDVLFNRFERAMALADPRSEPASWTKITIRVRTFMAFKILQYLGQFLGTGHLHAIHGHSIPSKKYQQVRATRVQTTFFGPDPADVYLSFYQLVNPHTPGSSSHLDHIKTHYQNIMLTLEVDWHSMLRFKKLPRPPRHSKKNRNQTNRQDWPPPALYECSLNNGEMQTIKHFILAMPYIRVIINRCSNSGRHLVNHSVELIVGLINFIHTTKPSLRIVLSGFLSEGLISYSHGKPINVVCFPTELTIQKCGPRFIPTFLAAIVPASSFNINLHVSKRGVDILQVLNALTDFRRTNITFTSSYIRFILMYPYPRLPCIQEYIQQLSARLIPIPLHQPYNISYTLQEFVNLSLWAYHPFPHPELIAESMPDDESTRHLAPHINRMFCFRIIITRATNTPSYIANYLHKMRRYIWSTIPKNTIPIQYHSLTDLNIHFSYKNSPKLSTLVLALTQFIIEIYPTVTKITISNVSLDPTVAPNLVKQLKFQRRNYLNRNHHSRLPDLYLTMTRIRGQDAARYLFTRDRTKEAQQGTIIHCDHSAREEHTPSD
ncbi:hypothetical protein NEHOM01_0283 [Nematocida homosporus]|uniref:uncharacterized protein n=1 Tax=Nematocida homosporus TaxID=1912981 RepID=UPI00221EB9BF|nr:uncharacterized protein NEHOM01_0283 [Nematocida homosporus]KAI5184608.1 hypothetical protein NEHOM01_0283 [Nematocida homosporus]